MKSVIQKLSHFFKSVFRHNCQNHKELVSSNYFKCGSSGVVFSMGKDYKCNKCGNKWTDNSPDNSTDINYFGVLKKSLPYF